MKSLLQFALMFVILFSNNVYSSDEPVKFKNQSHEQRYLSLTEEIRCLVCQNQSLADSNADLAQDLRKEIYDMIVSEKSDEQIIQFLVERYGDFVLYSRSGCVFKYRTIAYQIRMKSKRRSSWKRNK